MANGYSHLAVQERAWIETQLRLGMSPGAIARGLLRPRSTVTREIRRNGWQSVREQATGGRSRIAGGYRCLAAERRARQRAVQPRVPRKLIPGNPLWSVVVEHLRQGLSPAQIASTLARMPDAVQLSYETIYTAFYTMPRGHLRSNLLALLRRRHHARRPQRRNDGRSKPSIPEMTLIDQRPIEIPMRLVPGPWEGDRIIGKGNLSQVGTLVERSTLFVALVQLTSSKADVTAQAFSKILKRCDSQLRRSMTFDQGCEMRYHKARTANPGVDVYFAHPHAPWERGISENTNGLLRQYLPKGTDLSLFSQEELDDIAWRLNTRPRKTLGWKAPAELFLPEGTFDFVQHWSTIIPLVALGP